MDFLKEAQAMKKIYMSITSGGDPASAPVNVPLPVGELVSKRVLVMDFVQGTPLNKLSDKMKERGIKSGSPEARIAGRRILNSLSQAFGRMIFVSGFIHGDPHPGNIFIGEGAKQVSLIDCGQFKSLGRERRLQFAELVLAVGDYQDAINDKNGIAMSVEEAKLKLANCARSFGIECVDGREEETDLACAIALVLFSDTGTELPGGYSSNELDENSPIKLLTSFPQELVLLGRATVLLKGIAKKLQVPLSLVDTWRGDCQETLAKANEPALPLWSGSNSLALDTEDVGSDSSDTGVSGDKIRFKQVVRLLKDWAKGKGTRFAERTIQKLPPSMKTRVLEYIVERQENMNM